MWTFVSETRARFNKDKSGLDNIETHMTNMGATVKNLEVQIGQLARVVNSRQQEKFSRDTKANLREHYNAITLRSGRVVEESEPIEGLIPTHVLDHVKEKLVKEQKVQVEITKKISKPNSISFLDNPPIL